MPSQLRFYPGPLRALLIEPGGAVSRELVKRAIRVESAAKVRASGRPGPRVRSGRLRSSIRWQVGVGSFEADAPFVVSVVVAATTGAHVTIGSDVEYSGYVELGTSRAPEYPYLRPALLAAMPARIITLGGWQ